MPKIDVPDHLPAPLSLTLEEASKVAAGSGGLVVSVIEPWWWKGQAAIVASIDTVATVSPAALGKVAGLTVQG